METAGLVGMATMGQGKGQPQAGGITITSPGSKDDHGQGKDVSDK